MFPPAGKRSGVKALHFAIDGSEQVLKGNHRPLSAAPVHDQRTVNSWWSWGTGRRGLGIWIKTGCQMLYNHAPSLSQGTAWSGKRMCWKVRVELMVELIYERVIRRHRGEWQHRARGSQGRQVRITKGQGGVAGITGRRTLGSAGWLWGWPEGTGRACGPGRGGRA